MILANPFYVLQNFNQSSYDKNETIRFYWSLRKVFGDDNFRNSLVKVLCDRRSFLGILVDWNDEKLVLLIHKLL